MKSIISLEKIKLDLQEHIKLSKKQLKEHESGENRLSIVAAASAEENLEKNKALVEKYTMMIDEITKLDGSDPNIKEKIEESIDRKKYYQNNKIRLENDKVKDNDEKIDIFMILDEIKEDIFIENEILFDMTFKRIEHYLIISSDAKSELLEIKKDFMNDIKDIKGIYLNDFSMLNIKIVMVISQFKILIDNIKESRLEEKNFEEFPELPKFENWWIEELFETHLAYFTLTDWKNKITSLCCTQEQKIAWEYIFTKWVFIKKFLSNKGKVAYEYHFMFDSYVHNYIALEEETDENNIEYTKQNIQKIIKSQNLKPLDENYEFSTNHLKYKKEMLK